MTSSASASMVARTVRSSALAVLRLMIFRRSALSAELSLHPNEAMARIPVRPGHDCGLLVGCEKSQST
jgi:hypothetical protein